MSFADSFCPNVCSDFITSAFSSAAYCFLTSSSLRLSSSLNSAFLTWLTIEA